MASTTTILDKGHNEFATHISVVMQPGEEGGHVDLTPETITRMIGCDPETVGHCGAALSLDHLEINGADMPVDSHVILTTPDGSPLNSHCANHIDESGVVSGVHGNIRAGNVRNGLGIKIPLQPHTYTNGGTRQENMTQSLATMKNWADHRGISKNDIIAMSTSEVKEGLDHDGNKHVRLLVHEDSPIGKLVQLNPTSDHPVMSVYNASKLTKVGGKLVMHGQHVESLASTLADTLTACTPLSAEGLRIQIRPMKHHAKVLQEPTRAQLDMKFVRQNIMQVMNPDDPSGNSLGKPVTSTVLSADNADPEAQVRAAAEINNAVWAAPLGASQTKIISTDTHDNVNSVLGSQPEN